MVNANAARALYTGAVGSAAGSIGGRSAPPSGMTESQRQAGSHDIQPDEWSTAMRACRVSEHAWPLVDEVHAKRRPWSSIRGRPWLQAGNIDHRARGVAFGWNRRLSRRDISPPTP